MIQEITPINEELWDELAKNDVLCSRPWMELSAENARKYLNKNGLYFDNLKQKSVLCLACGGGQQSIAFALLGANVTVVDFSAEQLKRDQIAADHHKLRIEILKSDMRELTALRDQTFDIIYQPYSINYIPSVEEVFDEVFRLLKPGAIYDLMFHNPFVHGTWKDGCWGNEWREDELWQGRGYPIWQPYRDGQPIKTLDPHWNFSDREDKIMKLKSPKEYRHTLSTIINGLIGRGFEILQLQEEMGLDDEAAPGTWEHYKSCAPPWLYLLSRKSR
ncbi:MAG: methyltransferase domain-containing protein [Saprospiraceae bacterium]|nr:methyltransferase domain-containing protein [Saprospiraceae bacterium]